MTLPVTAVLQATDGSTMDVVTSLPIAGASSVQFSDFAKLAGSNRPAGMVLPAAGLVAPGVVYSMTPKSSTKAGLVPVGTGNTNNLTLVGTPKGLVGVRFSGFTVLATDQGHEYNGVTFDHLVNCVIEDLKIIGVKGSDHKPVGETFGGNEWGGNGNTYSRIEVDGKGVGACPFGTNSSTDITITDLYAHDCPYSRPAFWRTNGLTITNMRSINNWGGLNLEQCSGKIRVAGGQLYPSLANASRMHIHLASITTDQTDIVFDDVDFGQGLAGKAPTCMISAGYTGQVQKTPPTVRFNGAPVQWLPATGSNPAKAAASPTQFGVLYH